MQKSAIGASVAASCAACSMFFAEPLWAADKDLLDVLLGNGAITQAQYDSPLEKEEPTSEEVVEAVATVLSGGFNVDDDESRYSIKIGTRLHAEASGHDGRLPAGIEATDGTEPRRARIETKGFMLEWSRILSTDSSTDLREVADRLNIFQFRTPYTSQIPSNRNTTAV